MESGWSTQNNLPAPDRLGRVGAPHWIARIDLVEAALRYPMERALNTDAKQVGVASEAGYDHPTKRVETPKRSRLKLQNMRKPRKTPISFISVKFPCEKHPQKRAFKGYPFAPVKMDHWRALAEPTHGTLQNTVGKRRNHPVLEHRSMSLLPTEWDGPSPNSNRPLGWPDRFQDGWFCSKAFWMPNHSQGCQILSKRPMVGGVSPSRSNAIGLGNSDKFQDLYPIDPTYGGGGANPGMNDPPL